MTSKVREEVFHKFAGLCAYSGHILGPGWQVDHMCPPKLWYAYNKEGDPEQISNLMPCMRSINHYKRCQTLEQFRQYMLTFHKRLQKLPKNTKVHKTVKRKAYMQQIADLFGITVDKPFSGKFFFETFQDS